jgi:hypothetical protein
MFWALRSLAKFGIVLGVMSAICTVIWSRFITDTLYNCTDAIGLDYLHPGDWVHQPVAFVSHVVAGRSMSEPDTLKEGWSIAGLWGLWFLFFGVSLAVSVWLGRKTWLPKQGNPAA